MKTSRVVLMGMVALVLVAFTFGVAPTTTQAAEPTAYRMVVPHAAGSGADRYARLLSDRMAKVLGKPVVVENYPGAGGIKGMLEIIKAPKDGYTFGLTTANVVIYPSVMKNLPYDPLKDITPIGIIGEDYMVIVANPGLAVRNIKELIAMAKAQPGKLNYGSPGSGTVPHLSAELFLHQAGIKITHVPYKGGSQLTADVMGGHVPLGSMVFSQATEQTKAGKLRMLGVTGAQRHPAMPDVPTIAEQGVPGYSYKAWAALIGPANLQQPITRKINAALQEVLKLKEVRDGIVAQGSIVVGGTPEEAAKTFKADFEKNANAVKASGVKFE
jgi:tripartite-type tricarboxylate transporter receptor subunit TctC